MGVVWRIFGGDDFLHICMHNVPVCYAYVLIDTHVNCFISMHMYIGMQAHVQICLWCSYLWYHSSYFTTQINVLAFNDLVTNYHELSGLWGLQVSPKFHALENLNQGSTVGRYLDRGFFCCGVDGWGLLSL